MIHLDPTPDIGEDKTAPASFGAGNSATRPEAVEVETSEPQPMLLPSDLFKRSQSERSRAAFDRQATAGGAV